MTGFSPKTRKLMIARAGDFHSAFLASWDYPVCEVMAHCQGAKAIHGHHRRNRGSGGSRRPETNQAANGLMVCFTDHDWIGAHPEEAYRFGWLLRQHQTPADVPALRRGVWVTLDNEGGFSAVPAPIGGAA